MNVSERIGRLIDGWCERRALGPLRILLPGWPPPNGFTDEWQQVWAAMRHTRAMCRDDLAQNGESEEVNAIIAELSRMLFPGQPPQDLERAAERITAAIFGDRSV